MRFSRTLRSVAAAVVVAACLSIPTASQASPACANVMESYYPVTLHVQIGKFNKTYRVGETVKVNILVTRPSDQDPAGAGIYYPRPASVPAEEVNLGVGISVGRDFLPGYGFTNAKGRTTVRIKIERYIKPGAAHVQAYATKRRVDTTCLTVDEAGYRAVNNAFRVVD